MRVLCFSSLRISILMIVKMFYFMLLSSSNKEYEAFAIA